MCDGRVTEGGGVGRRQDNLQQDLGGAASLHPGGAADGFRLDSDIDIDIESDTKKLERPEEGVVMMLLYPNCWVDDEGLLLFGEFLHPLYQRVESIAAAFYGLSPDT